MKGFVFIYGTELFLRFVHSKAFCALEAEHDLTYVLLESSEMMKGSGIVSSFAAGSKIKWVPMYAERFRRWSELFDISCIRYRDRSSSFEVRVQESILNSLPRGARLAKLASPEVYEQHRKAVEGGMGLHPDILALTLRERPDFYVLPSALLDYMTDDVLQIAAALSVPTLLLAAGWDNLSSKGLIYHHPTLVGVWGEQTRRHAIEVQDLDPERVRILGAPHYETYFVDPTLDRAALRADLGVPPEGTLILFAGTLRLFDETALLRKMDQSIDTDQLPVHVLYRPHPWRNERQSEESFFAHPWRHVTMDPQMIDTYRLGKEKKAVISEDSFLFRLDHLTRIYQAVDAVISPMSTVLLEAMLFGIPSMAVAFGDGKHSWSADKVSRMSHFKEMYETPGIIVCRDQGAFFADVRALISRIGDETAGAVLRQSTQQFVYRDGRSYATRLAELVNQMLAETRDKPLYDSVQVRPGKRYLARGLARKVWVKAKLSSRQMRSPWRRAWGWVRPSLKRDTMDMVQR